MASEENKFFTFARKEDWEQGAVERIEIRTDGSLALWSVPSFLPATANPLTLPDTNACPAGLAFRAPDTLFISDKHGHHIYEFNLATQTLTPLVCIETKLNVARPFLSPHGLAVKGNTLYMADTGHHRVVALYLYNYQVRYSLSAVDQWHRPQSGKAPGEFNTPTDVAVDSQGNVYVADHGNHRIQKFNRCGEYVMAFDRDQDDSLKKPLRLAIDGRDRLYVLDQEKPYLVQYSSNGEFIDRIGAFNQIPNFQPISLAVDRKGKLYLGQAAEAQDPRIHVFDARGTYLGTCPGYRGPAASLATDPQENLYAGVCTIGKGQVLRLTGGKASVSSGVIYLPVLDSEVKDCQWHRLQLAAELPPKTRIEVSYYASEERNSEIRNLPPEKWDGHIVNAADALFQQGRGRYQWLKLAFYGDGFHTPVLRRLQVFFPRISYLRYLPAIYWEPAANRDFLERFLSLFETVLQDTETNIAMLSRYFEPFATDSAFIPWLASWLALAVDESWPEAKKRLLLAQAHDLYKKRGTVEGLASLIALYSDHRPIIIEHYDRLSPMILGQQPALGVNTVLGKRPKHLLKVDETSLLETFMLREQLPPPAEPLEYFAYDFTVIVNRSKIQSEAQLNTLKRIITDEQPAHTRAYVRLVNAEFRLGLDSFIEVGTVVAAEPYGPVFGGQTPLGSETLLKTKDRFRGKIGTHSQIGIDTVLN